MKKLTIQMLMLVFTIASVKTTAQDHTYLNLRKYWWYHYRLVNNYLVKGDCQGCSEIINERDLGTDDASGTHTKVAKWGDQTISLGMYIGVLATEYRLLKNAGQPTDTTVQELYYALKAFNRLDEKAESYFSGNPSTTADLNGFFIRDDVDTSFLTRHPRLKTGIGSTRTVLKVDSDFSATDKTTDEMSHDQIWHVFMGLSLVSHLLDDNVNYNGLELNDKTHNSDLKTEARAITSRIMDYINDGGDWFIHNPITHNLVSRGSNVIELSYPACEAACFIETDHSDQDFSDPPPYPIHTCGDFHDWVSYTDALAWNELGKIPAGVVYTFSDEDYKVDVLAAMGHSWYSSMYPTIPNPVAVLVGFFDIHNWRHPWQYITEWITSTPILPVNVTTYELGARAPLRDWQHLTLLHQVLHGGSNPVFQSTYQNLLNSAPCDGPYNFGYPEHSAPFDWSTDNRMLSPDRRGEWTVTTPYVDEHGVHEHEIGEDKVGAFHGEYNGLDYMIYYNLYTLINGTSGTPFVNYMDRHISAPFPTGAGPTLSGDSAHPVTVEGFNSIVADNTINPGADVDYRAGQVIHLAPGFHAAAGSNFHAYIQPFACATDGDYRMASAGGSDTTRMRNAVAYTGQTTYVNYPASRTNPYNEQAANNVIQNPVSSNAAATQAMTSATAPALNSAISVRPNPNNGTFRLFISGSDKVDAKVTLMSMFGNTILQLHVFSPETIIDLSSEAKGIYYLKVENEKGINVQKIIYQ